MGTRSLEVEITKIAQRCDMHVYPHKLRHTFATSGLRGGMPLDKLQALMGHAKPETTLIYAKLDTTDLQLEHSRVYA
jgi:site-specific recombinase XerD